VSRLLARIMLALLMLPLAAMIYIFIALVFIELVSRRADVVAFLLADVVTAAFVTIYWLRLWRGTVRWTPERRQRTTGVAVLSVIAGVLAGIPGGALIDDSFGIFFGGVTAILLWLAGTVFVWRETTTERADRLRGRGPDTLVCPVCGYNMTGLREALCPECGASFQINELLASQPQREGAALEAAES
jgi:hypothetical protein